MIALLALDDETIPTNEALAASLQSALQESAAVELGPTSEDEDEYVVVAAGPVRARLAGKNGPIPTALLESTCRTAWYWPEAAEVLQRHRTHVVVALEPGEGSAVHRCLFLTRVVALLGARFDYTGVYWDNAPMVHSGPAFSQLADRMSLEQLPLNLWIDFRLIPEEDGTFSLATFGLQALGQKEVEIRASSRDPQEHLWWAFNAAHYVLEGGVIEDDQTLGKEGGERVLVRHEPSMFDQERTVLALKL